jgi:hypothetical protein
VLLERRKILSVFVFVFCSVEPTHIFCYAYVVCTSAGAYCKVLSLLHNHIICYNDILTVPFM